MKQVDAIEGAIIVGRRFSENPQVKRFFFSTFSRKDAASLGAFIAVLEVFDDFCKMQLHESGSKFGMQLRFA